MRKTLFCAILLSALKLISTQDLRILSNVKYPNIGEGCDFGGNEPCSPLSDVWGIKYDTRNYAIVGAANGVELVDVSNPSLPKQTGVFYKGCLTEWRDMKSFEHYVYVVNDRTVMCLCTKEDQKCQMQAYVESDGEDPKMINVSDTFPMFDGDITAADVAIAEPLNACSNITNGEELKGKLAIVERDDCMFADKIKNCQQVGAKGVLIVNNRDDVIYPSMSGYRQGIVIPSVLLKYSEGKRIMENIKAGVNVKVTLSPEYYVKNPYYSEPTGLVILDMKNLDAPLYTRNYFDFAHNILIDEQRKILYVAGFTTADDEFEIWDGPDELNPLGGILILDISKPMEPLILGSFTTNYIHDVDTAYKEGIGFILIGCAIYDETVFIFDVNLPSGDLSEKIIAEFSTLLSPHNAAVSRDGGYLFISHEEPNFPITIWDIRNISNISQVGKISIPGGGDTIPHNVFVKDDMLWISYYSEGVIVFDISDPANPVLIDQEDTSPYVNGFHGVWGVYPFRNLNESIIAYASDIETGLFVMELKKAVDKEVPVAPTPDPIHPTATAKPSKGKKDIDEEEKDLIKTVVEIAMAIVVLLMVVIVAFITIRRMIWGMHLRNDKIEEKISEISLEDLGETAVEAEQENSTSDDMDEELENGA